MLLWQHLACLAMSATPAVCSASGAPPSAPAPYSCCLPYATLLLCAVSLESLLAFPALFVVPGACVEVGVEDAPKLATVDAPSEICGALCMGARELIDETNPDPTLCLDEPGSSRPRAQGSDATSGPSPWVTMYDESSNVVPNSRKSVASGPSASSSVPSPL